MRGARLLLLVLVLSGALAGAPPKASKRTIPSVLEPYFDPYEKGPAPPSLDDKIDNVFRPELDDEWADVDDVDTLYHADGPVEPRLKPRRVVVQLLSLSDFHGHITRLPVLATLWKRDRAEYPATLAMTAGDSFGASPALSYLFSDVPAIMGLRMLGVGVDTLGNHNFDRSVEHVAQLMRVAGANDAAGAPLHFVCANLANSTAVLPELRPYRVFTVGSIQVAVVGIISPSAVNHLEPGALGPLRITDPVRAAMDAQHAARKGGADVVVCLVHMGIDWAHRNDSRPTGQLTRFAEQVSGFDVIMGDHTNVQWSGMVKYQTVVENRSFGRSYARTLLTLDQYASGKTELVSTQVQFVAPDWKNVDKDERLQTLVTLYEARLKPKLKRVLAHSSRQLASASRRRETALGNTVTDCLRRAYNSTFAVLTSATLRSALTCSPAGTEWYCPRNVSAEGPFPITEGSLQSMSPYESNMLVTMHVSGFTLRSLLEWGVSQIHHHGVSLVSGLCYHYNATRPTGQRVSDLRFSTPQAVCRGAFVDVHSRERRYQLATIDWLANMASSKGVADLSTADRTERDQQNNVLRKCVQSSTFSPASVEGRVVCQGECSSKPKATTMPSAASRELDREVKREAEKL